MRYYGEGISYFMARQWVTLDEARAMFGSSAGPGKLKPSVIAVRGAWGLAWR